MQAQYEKNRLMQQLEQSNKTLEQLARAKERVLLETEDLRKETNILRDMLYSARTAQFYSRFSVDSFESLELYSDNRFGDNNGHYPPHPPPMNAPEAAAAQYSTIQKFPARRLQRVHIQSTLMHLTFTAIGSSCGNEGGCPHSGRAGVGTTPTGSRLEKYPKGGILLSLDYHALTFRRFPTPLLKWMV